MQPKSFLRRTAVTLAFDAMSLVCVEGIRLYAGAALSWADWRFLAPVALVLIPFSILGQELGYWRLEKRQRAPAGKPN